MSKLSLDDPISAVPQVGDRVKEHFARLNIFSVGDLFNFMPRTLLDLKNVEKISSIKTKVGERGVINAKITSVHVARSKFKKMWITQAILSDESGSIKALWFNQPYLRKSLQKRAREAVPENGTEKESNKLVFAGDVTLDKNKKIFLNNPEIYQESGIFPVYPQTKNLSSRQISNVIKKAIDVGYWPQEYLDPKILKKSDLCSQDCAFMDLHFPKSQEKFKKARERYVFNRLLELIVANLYIKAKNSSLRAPKIEIDKKLLKKFITSLPFQLTDGQLRSVNEITVDLNRPSPMNRLIQGDVGSGKTVVALLSSLLVIKSGYRVVWIAPTQILATQHFETAKKFFSNFKVSVSLVTANTKKNKSEIANPESDLVIGTHALLQGDIKLEKLGMVVVDEQHRFGVEQRSILISKLKLKPHFLSLSATPIPRTLSHVIYGNLDISVIESKPQDRLRVKTYLIPEGKRLASYKFIKSLVSEGQQAFVVCPLIETNDGLEPDDRKTVLSEVKNLQNTPLKDTRIAFLHGRMKPSEKDDVLKKMQSGEIDILVSTSVIEVGIDIPGATVMIIEDAERFGLSQLHQFRGRIGRNNLQSFCFCFTKNIEDEKTRERLKAFVGCSDGFALAEKDLAQRGPGAIFGESQSGFRGLNPLWFENSLILKKATEVGHELIEQIDEIDYLKTRILALIDNEHLE